MLNLTISPPLDKPYKLTLEETKNTEGEILVIGKKNYKIGGDDKAVKTFKSHIQSISSCTFNNMIDFEASLKNECNLIIKTHQAAESILPKSPETVEAAVHAIQQSNGSGQAIRKEVKKLQAAHTPLTTMMQIATTLVKQGNTVKSSHFFFYLQLNLDEETRTDCIETMMRTMGEAFLGYGKEHNNPIALDFALMYSLNSEDMALAKQKLSEIASNNKNPTARAHAEIALKRTAISDVLNPIQNICNSEQELNNLKESNETVKHAFEQAQAIQTSVDTGESPLMVPPGKIVDITDSEGKSISLHVNLRGTRVHEKDPVIIFEAGLGCFSADWQFVQEALPKKEMRTMSYDRAGLGWSSLDSAEPTIERTIGNLKALLDKLELKPPYIFVGHSYGGIVGQLFTVKHPDDVKGLILVDAGVEDYEATLGEPEEARDKGVSDYLPAATTKFTFDSRSHEVGDDMALRMHYAVSKTLHNHTMHNELKYYMRAGQSLVHALAEDPDKQPIKCPLKVITAGRYPNMDDQYIDANSLNEEEAKDKEKWMAGQKKILNRGLDSSQIIAEDSDHMILHHEPGLIVAQIQIVKNQVIKDSA